MSAAGRRDGVTDIYQDNGCEVNPVPRGCQTCPLPRCKHDMTGPEFHRLMIRRRWAALVQDVEGRIAAGLEPAAAVRQVAARNQITERTVYRARRRLKEEAEHGIRQVSQV